MAMRVHHAVIADTAWTTSWGEVCQHWSGQFELLRELGSIFECQNFPAHRAFLWDAAICATYAERHGVVRDSYALRLAQEDGVGARVPRGVSQILSR